MKQPTALMVFAGWCQRWRGLGRLAADEVVVDRDEDHGCQKAADEDLHQAEEERAPTDKGEARQQKLIEILHHPPVREQQSSQDIEREDHGREDRQGPRNGPEM